MTCYFADTSSTLETGAASPTGGGPQFDLHAPTGGTYANIPMFEGPSANPCSTELVLNCNTTSTAANPCMAGLIHTPTRKVTMYSAAYVNYIAIAPTCAMPTFQTSTWNETPPPLTYAVTSGGGGSARLVR